jgi:hypothetical protein
MLTAAHARITDSMVLFTHPPLRYLRVLPHSDELVTGGMLISCRFAYSSIERMIGRDWGKETDRPVSTGKEDISAQLFCQGEKVGILLLRTCWTFFFFS